MDDQHSTFEKRLVAFEKRLVKIEHYMLWCSIVNTLRFALILIPLILAFIYIPPFVNRYIPVFGNFVGALQRQGILHR